MRQGRLIHATFVTALATLAVSGARAQDASSVAAKFGAREMVAQMSLSPDGKQLAFIAPLAGRGSQVIVRGVGDDTSEKSILSTPGTNDRLINCDWASSRRLICTVYGVTSIQDRWVPWTRLIGVDANGQNMKTLSTRDGFFTRGLQLGGGAVLDWLPEGKGAVLMARVHLPDDHLGSRIGSAAEGVGVDRVDTVTLAATPVEQPNSQADGFLSDGYGVIRIMSVADTKVGGEQMSGKERYYFRRKGSRTWEPLSTYDGTTRRGFEPVAVDALQNVAYGFQQQDGRRALFSMALDGSGVLKPIFARPDVDVAGLVRVGRRQRVVGVTYHTDIEHTEYFDPAIARIVASLHKALPNQPTISIVDVSLDERKVLIFAGSDQDPGVFYVLDQDTHDLHILSPARPQLEGVKLASMRSTFYPAADGTPIPAYLTLPPDGAAKGLPAIVLPHGGPEARDEWGFDWLPQFFASRGYAVLQPEFRGSAGYGEAWFVQNGFRSWRTAIGDVIDGARWLAAQGIADPKRMAIVGWSYGGYAALQAAVIAPDLFKAVVAIAPVTDLAALKQESLSWSDNSIRGDFIGSGAHITEGSPAQNAARIKAPVLLVHGTNDANVNYQESVMMEARLKRVGGKVEFISFPGLDHQLEDSSARTQLLDRSDALIRSAIGR